MQEQNTPWLCGVGTQSSSKETNPKDALGQTKVSLSVVPANVITSIALGLTEGACKYGAHNYRVKGVRASIYYSALLRHIMSWWEGEDTDQDSGLNHLEKAASCLAVLLDARHQGMMYDDRPVKSKPFVEEANRRHREVVARFPEPVKPYLAIEGDPSED